MRLLIDTNVFLFRRGQHATFQEFVKDMFIDAGLSLMALQPEDMEMIVHAACKFGLDFDDAYQYGICEKYNLTLVSLDAILTGPTAVESNLVRSLQLAPAQRRLSRARDVTAPPV